MAEIAPTFAFEGEEVYAVLDGQVIASGRDISVVEEEARPHIEAARKIAEDTKREKAKKTATHIVTPNGIKGTILGRVASTWGEEITVRFENGEIHSFETSGREQWVTEGVEKTASSTPIAKFTSDLDAEYEHDRPGLKARYDQLRAISRQAALHIANGVSYDDQTKLNEIKIVADAEAQEVREAYDYLEAADNEAFAPPAPFNPQVAEQATVGVRDDGSPWLDAAVADMIAEAEGVDYDKFLSEEPGQFVAELPDAVVGDQGATADMALAHVTERTAAVNLESPEKVDEYRKLFVARAEAARRVELAERKTTTKREAAAERETESNLPDDALFMR